MVNVSQYARAKLLSKDAINEGHAGLGGPMSWDALLHRFGYWPAPLPTIVGTSRPSSARRLANSTWRPNDGALPDAVRRGVGGGSNAIGMFHPFTQDEGVAIYGAEADGDSTQGSAT